MTTTTKPATAKVELTKRVLGRHHFCVVDRGKVYEVVHDLITLDWWASRENGSPLDVNGPLIQMVEGLGA